ncbi:hypothetical protein J6W78_01400 [bacterium]|nr:hypothetical protein [bacterium]
MKKFVFLILFIFSFTLFAEEGEIQINIGGGGFFPFSLKTDSKTTVVYASWNAGLNFFFGLTDNFDIGLQPSFTRVGDTSRKAEFQEIKGKEYFDYWRVQTLVLARYNVFPGTFFSPHIVAGGGFKVETFSNIEFIDDGGRSIATYKKEDYAKVNGVVAAGIDFQFRVWEWIMLSAQVLYKWSPHDHSLDLFGFFGATFFVNYYNWGKV